MELHRNLYQISVQIFVITSIFLQLTTTTTALGNDTDRTALLKFKESITHDPHGVLSSWNDSIHFCNWPGVTCSHRHERVTTLNLLGYDLKGLISPFIANLTFLRFINFRNNSFFGELPQEVGHLHRLQHLNLTNNMLGGKIPVSLINCSELRMIDLTNNRFIGNIPPELGSLINLEVFQVSKNNLTGGIPTSFGNLSSTSFKFFFAAYNHLVGNIPDEIGRLTNLHAFAAQENSLSGLIPPSFYNLSSISIISLTDNRLLNGSLPENIGFSFPNLQLLAIGALNNFVGQIPTNLGNLQDIRWLNFGGNYFGSNSSDDWGFLTSLTNCSTLRTLILSLNNFGGVLPDTIGNLSTQLNGLYLEANNVQGTIPASLGNLLNLDLLLMDGNLLTGSIPKSLGKLTKLQKLTLNQNRLSGEIPSSLGNLTRLFRLYLSDNKLEGSIPPIIGNCQNLLELDISNNKLGGTIPFQVFGVPSLSILLNLSHNGLTGSLPVEVGNLNKLSALDLSANNLSGEIPNTIGECSSLEILSLQKNFFHGKIPQPISSVKGLVHLDLSQNNLSGQIPGELQNLHALPYLNVSCNNLEGEVPTKGVFQNASAVHLTGNGKLCGAAPILKLPACSMKGSKRGKFRLLKTIIVICAVLVLVLLFSFSLAQYRRRKPRKKSSSKLSSIEFLSKVSYRDLFDATCGFSPNNLIGSGGFGSVYKATVDEEEKNIFAVKVLKLEKKGASKSFMAECKALKNIRHRNLVKILTACSSVDYNGNDFKALVFEFMENGSLEDWLHRNKENETRWNLNLLQRLNIIIDLASALHYLHDQCEQPIIHCDLKPSNVLLDKELVAHLSDFGLARLLSNTEGRSRQSQTSTVGIEGSIGYTAPGNSIL
ncbi:putative receptor-like protein kinase At3g47110 [Ziziphus jujuba]|uniref:Receptor-like protein kinase At3g47110 n=1 Tax=Ziziphus jujuba TaxID=326968 RepID=A0ABM4AGI0_ZIZJJ|nr:putative receptor-like protein kinase At3g47110 [Ziziphus jujuba]